MSSDRSPHTARLAPGRQYAWEVSWLPGRHLNHNEAITAMVIADTTASGGVRPGHQAWPHVQGWAVELGMTGPQALDRVAGPPRWARRQEKTAAPPGTDSHGSERDDPDPLDRGSTDSPDWPEPEWPDPSWPGFAATRRHPAHLSNLAVADWHKDRYPGKSACIRDARNAGRDPQPAPEPGTLPDWEAGQ